VDPHFPDDAVEIGRVMGSWGVKGWIKVQPFSLDPQALFSTKRWFVRSPELASLAWGGEVTDGSVLKVVHAKEHGDMVIASIQGLEDRDAAEALRGGRVFVSRASFPTATEGEYYWVDLIGLSVANREGVVLGEVVGLMETGAHDVLRIRPPAMTSEASAVTPAKGARKNADPDERLIPFVAAYVDGVDIASRRITVDWGLDY
jgi:16S rRNA processing protein RimM